MPCSAVVGAVSVCGDTECSPQLSPLVGTEGGTSYVPVEDWQTHFSSFSKPVPVVKGISISALMCGTREGRCL